MPNQLPMAFKGGTSLSKAFRVINRFSEDVDITIDYKGLSCEDPFAENISKTKIKKTFYNSSYAKYDDCLSGTLRLVPSTNYIVLLKEDFNNMIENKMFYGEKPDFNKIIEQFHFLENEINKAC